MADTEPIGTFPYKRFKDESIPESAGGSAAPYGSDVQMNNFARDDVTPEEADAQLRDVTVVPNNTPTGDESGTRTGTPMESEEAVEGQAPRASPFLRLTMNGGITTAPGTMRAQGIPDPGSELEEEWTWRNLILSLFSLCCCGVCGMFATVLAMLAYVDHRVADYEAARTKRNAALRLAIAGIVTGTVLLIVIVTVILLRKIPL